MAKEGSRIKPLKVKNCLDLLACKWHATYRWKVLDEGYNFSLDLISVGFFQKKLWASKVAEVSISRISRFSTLVGNLETK
jgi:hypothetical protein